MRHSFYILIENSITSVTMNPDEFDNISDNELDNISDILADHQIHYDKDSNKIRTNINRIDILTHEDVEYICRDIARRLNKNVMYMTNDTTSLSVLIYSDVYESPNEGG